MRARLSPSMTITLLGALACAACDGPARPLTYRTDTKPILDAKCASCHSEGGIGPMPFETYDDVEPFLGVIEVVVENRTMPPWPADPACNEYANDFSLTDDERTTLLAWLQEGGAEGDEAADGTATDGLAADPRASGIRVDVVLETSGPYVPKRDDDYRCYAIAWPYDEPVYISGFDMLPGDPANVHHVNVFLNPPSAAEEFLGYEALDEEGGYECRYGSSVLLPSLIGSWAPGASGMAYPEGTGQLVEPGSVITFQVHYAGPGVPDASALALEIESSVERRGVGAPFYWFNKWDAGQMEIPAGDDDVTHAVQMPTGLTLVAIAPWFGSDLAEISIVAVHMHQLGKRAELSVRSPVGDTCLLKIPRWDFHQQMGFTLKKPVELYLPDDEIFLSCTWDNSAENQPEVDGVRPPPQDVNWGGGTADEMCIGFAYFTPVGP